MMQNPAPSTGKASTRRTKASVSVKRDINLLPVNENSERIARNGTIALAIIGGVLMLAAVAIYLPSTWLWDLQHKAELAESEVASKKHFEAEFNAVVAQRNELQDMITSLETVNSIGMDPADMVDLLARTCPEKIVLLGTTLSNGALTVSGRAATDKDIAQFLVNLRTQPKVYEATLVAVKQDTDTNVAQKRLFELTVSLTPAPAPTADPAAATPAPATEGGAGK